MPELMFLMAFKVYVQKVSYFHHILLEGIAGFTLRQFVPNEVMEFGWLGTRDAEHMDSLKKHVEN